MRQCALTIAAQDNPGELFYEKPHFLVILSCPPRLRTEFLSTYDLRLSHKVKSWVKVERIRIGKIAWEIKWEG